MKNLKLIVIIFLSAQISSFAQCAVDATDFGNNTNTPSYNITGDVTVTLNEGAQTVTLDLGSNFMTAFGPDIRAYLVNSGGLSDVQLTATKIANLENFEFGLVGSNTIPQNGAKSFTVPIPNNTNIEDFDKVFFYCLEFDAFWDLGSIVPFSTSNCNVLSINDPISTKTEINMFPNPATDILNITNPRNDISEIQVFDINGNLIINKNENLNQIDVSTLNAGIYLVELTSNQKKNTKKLIVSK